MTDLTGKPTATDLAVAFRSRGIWVVVFCWLASVCEGLDLQAPGVTLPVLAPLFHLSSGQGAGPLSGFLSAKSLFLTMSTFGLFIGAIAGGRLSDLVGRKWVMVGSVGLFAVFTAVTAQSDGARMLLWMRFITGLGLGGCYANMLAIAVENVRPERRHAVVGLMHSGMPAGGALISLASYAWATPELWRNVYYLAAVAPTLALIGLVFSVPNVGPRDQLGDPKPSAAEALFGGGRGLSTSLLWISFLAGMMTQYILVSWLPSLLISRGLPRPAAPLAQMSYNVMSVPGSIIAGSLIDRPSRSASTLLIFGGAVVALILLPIVPVRLPLSLMVAGLVGFTATGSMAIVSALTPGVYPTSGRGTGVGFAVAMGRIGSAAGPLLAGAMIGAGRQPTQVLATMAPLMVLSGACAWWITRKVGRSANPVGDGRTKTNPELLQI